MKIYFVLLVMTLSGCEKLEPSEYCKKAWAVESDIKTVEKEGRLHDYTTPEILAHRRAMDSAEWCRRYPEGFGG